MGVFRGQTINTPSMLCVEDAIDGLQWAASVGGLPALIQRSRVSKEATHACPEVSTSPPRPSDGLTPCPSFSIQANLEVVQRLVSRHPDKFSFLAKDPATQSSTSVCLRVNLDDEKVTGGRDFGEGRRRPDTGLSHLP